MAFVFGGGRKDLYSKHFFHQFLLESAEFDHLSVYAKIC